MSTIYGHGRYAIRRAVERCERSIALDPGEDQVRLMWIGAKAALDEPDDAIAVYIQRIAAAPGSIRELRFLSAAYLAAKDFDAARKVIDAGLELDADNWALMADRGEVKALEREGRPAEAAASWQYIVDACDEHGWELTAAWPRQELQRLLGMLPGH